MSTLVTLGFGAGYLAFLAFLLFIVRPRAQSRRLQLLVNSVGLPLTHEIEPVVVAAQKREVRAGYGGIVAGIVIASIAMILAGVTAPGQVFLIDFTSVVAFAGIAIAVAALAHEDRRQRDGVRLARLRAVNLSDYRAALERWTPRTMVVLSLAAFIIRVVLTPGTFGLAAGFLYLYAALMVASLLVSEIAGRLLIRRGQPAGSELELAWDDALRARALSAISVAPLFLGMYFGIAAVALYPSSGSDAAALGVRIEAVVVLFGAALLLAAAIASASAKPQQRYLRRLWPELAK